MNVSELKSSFFGNLINIPGWSSQRKIVVIESDDWGSIRMPSRTVYDNLKRYRIDVDTNPFNKYDNLENEEDIYKLLTVLSKYKDANNNSPVITANFVMANPDFGKIRDQRYESYFYETINETYSKYPGCKRSLDLIQDGIKSGLLYPQCHGREHVNVCRWLNYLKEGVPEYLAAFEYETFAIKPGRSTVFESSILAALDYHNEGSKAFILSSLDEGLTLFEDLFGYKSESFIAPSYVWDDSMEAFTSLRGVKYLQTTNIQFIAGTFSNGRYKKKYRIIGRQNNYGQTYLVRNCYFEPATIYNYDWIKKCLKKMEFAFRWGKPAVISMHRLNFIGSIFPDNRKNNLTLLDNLLQEMLKKWPDIEFINSKKLGDLVTGLV